jgi:hypothetical protein
MFPNPQDALPLPPRPNLERYKKLAKKLVESCKTGDEKAIADWSEHWIRTLAKLAGWKTTRQALARIGRWTSEVEDFARRKLLGGEPGNRKCANVVVRARKKRNAPVEHSGILPSTWMSLPGNAHAS